jgi:Tfp pilus assembly protein PilO
LAKIDPKRKYFLIAMAFLLVAGVVYRIWPQIENVSTGENDVAIKRKQLVKYQKMVHSAVGLEKELSLDRVTLKKGEAGLLTGKTPALAAADIQKVVHEIAGKSHVEILSVRVLKPKEVGVSHYLSIPVEVSVKGTIRQFKEFLFQIMTSSKYLTVQRVQIKVSRRRSQGKYITSELIVVKITVNGFLKSSDEPTK